MIWLKKWTGDTSFMKENDRANAMTWYGLFYAATSIIWGVIFGLPQA